MAREYAQIKFSIWNDDSFLDLTVDAQHLYFVLLTDPELSYAGTGNWHPGRVAAKAGDWTRARVERAAGLLIQSLYIVVDDDTGEFLIRTFVRNDSLMKQRNLGVSMAMARANVASRGIRAVIVHELQRLKDEQPELAGFKPEQVTEVLEMRGTPAGEFPCGNPYLDPGADPSVDPQADPSSDPTTDPYVDPRVKGQVGGQPPPGHRPGPYNSNYNTNLNLPTSTSPEGGKVVGNLTGGARDSEPPSLIPDEWLGDPRRARCAAHTGVEDPGPCRGCGDARRAAESESWRRAAETRARTEARLESVRQCLLCDETGHIVGDDGAPLVPAILCTHQEDANAGLVLAARERIEAQEAAEAERRAIAAKAAAEARARWKRDPEPEPQEVARGPF